MAPLICLIAAFLVFRILGLEWHYFADWRIDLRAALGAMFLLTASAHWGKRRAELVRMVPESMGNAGTWVSVTGRRNRSCRRAPNSQDRAVGCGNRCRNALLFVSSQYEGCPRAPYDFAEAGHAGRAPSSAANHLYRGAGKQRMAEPIEFGSTNFLCSRLVACVSNHLPKFLFI